MLNIYKHKEVLLQEFYLDEDDITVRRMNKGYKNRWEAGDEVKPYISGRGKYPSLHIPKTKSSAVSMHQLITLLRGIKIPANMMIDHINGDVTDNSRQNLRIVTNRVNTRNGKKRINNTSGHSNITYNKAVGRYYVYFGHGSERLQKSAETLEEAIEIKKGMKQALINLGYTTRHCEHGSETIETTQ